MTAMPQPQAPVPDDEDYNSASDEDFRPDDVHSDSASEKSGASREEEGGEAGRQRRRTTQPKRKKARTGSPGQLDSGDETVAVRGKSYRADGARASRQKTRRRTQDGDGDGDRKAEDAGSGTGLDVNEIWKSMLSGDSTGVGSATAATSAGHGHPGDDSLLSAMPDQTDDLADGSRTGKGDSQTVRIRRIFKYAGEKVMEDREVPADSAEAKLYLAEGGDTEMPASSIKSPAQRNPELIRPLRRRSRFDPNPSGTVDNLPAHYRAATNVSGSDQATAGKNLADDPLRKADVKLNTVTKSKLDWAKHVDSVGLQEELKDYSKAKEGYLTRMDFLNRVDERVDEGRRAAKTS